MGVGIKADGGPERGYGHLVRTGSLASELLSQGSDVFYLTKTPDSVAELCPSAVETISLPEEDDLSQARTAIRDNDITTVVTDSYDVNLEYQQELTKVTETLCVFQATARHQICCDILLNTDLFADQIEYEWSGSEPTWCLGTDYLLLRDEFNKLAQQSATWRSVPERALVIMGGSDVNNTTPDVLKAFDGCSVSVDAIVGPGYSNYNEIKQTAKEIDCNINVLETPSDLPLRMFNADFAVTALGTTIYELMATQTPFIGIQQADNQGIVAETVEQRELGIITESGKPLGQSIETIIANRQLRRKLFEKYGTLVDGKGAKRVADILYNSLN